MTADEKSSNCAKTPSYIQFFAKPYLTNGGGDIIIII